MSLFSMHRPRLRREQFLTLMTLIKLITCYNNQINRLLILISLYHPGKLHVHAHHIKQEAQGLSTLVDKMEDNDHINWISERSRCIFHSKTCRFRDTGFLKI